MELNSYDVSLAELQGKEKPTSAVEVVISYIRSQIFQRKLRMGDKLPSEGELCEILNVGRGSVREAIKRLEAIQLLDIRRGDGTYVSSVSEMTAFDSLVYKIVLEDIDFEQILEYRIQLEICVIKLAIRHCTPEILAALHENCDSFSSYIAKEGEKEPEILHKMDLEFHRLLGKASGNRLLADVYRASLELFSPYILRNYQQGQAHHSPQETVDNHRIMVSAIERKDATGAVYAVCNATQLWNRWVLTEEK